MYNNVITQPLSVRSIIADMCFLSDQQVQHGENDERSGEE
jgi:hypothetical protein